MVTLQLFQLLEVVCIVLPLMDGVNSNFTTGPGCGAGVVFFWVSFLFSFVTRALSSDCAHAVSISEGTPL